MNSQARAWESEYHNPHFLSLSPEVSDDVVRFTKWLKHEGKEILGHSILEKEDLVVLDLGCGNGRHLNYFAHECGARGFGYDVSATAIDQARSHAKELGSYDRVNYFVRSIAEPFTEIPDASVDMVIDSLASNSLYAGERELLLGEVKRVLKPDGIFFTKALCLDGDRNAHNLLRESPGPENCTYILPDVDIMERVFTEHDFRNMYESNFEILFLKKQTGYTRWGSQRYKRRYIVGYLKKHRATPPSPRLRTTQ